MAGVADKPKCDLVMKGGITSGVVYPQLIADLAQKYSFKNIGGTSAGAIAAAGCAAAEYRAQVGGSGAGYETLSGLPTLLGSPVAGARDAQSMLFHLFQPVPALRKHFAVLVSMLNTAPLQAAGRALLAMLRQFWGAALLGLVLALLVATPVVMAAAPQLASVPAVGVALAVLLLWAGWTSFAMRRLLDGSLVRALVLWWLVGLVLTVVVLALAGRAHLDGRLAVATAALGITAPLVLALVLAVAGARFVATLLAGVHGNFYGICSGRTLAQDGTVGLTDWLTQFFNQLAGLPPDEVLTFGHLWLGRKPHPGERPDPSTRRINLEVMTTAVSQQMCYAIPFRQEAEKGFYYDPEEWARLFPAEVMRWMQQAAEAEAASEGADARVRRVVSKDGRALRRLPSSGSLPVVVAVRMSLSFPVLLSAVPLFAIDFTLKCNDRPQAIADFTYTATRVWFSDGGIASNMPLHFFDAMLPKHPTFAVNLKAPHPDFPVFKDKKACEQDGRVYLPTHNRAGRLRYWPDPNDATPAVGLAGFLGSIVNTMQNWRDEILFPYPGYRDRIVQLSQLPDEGGLNLNMPRENIAALSDAGQCAALRLIERFYYDTSLPDAPASAGWQNHQELRLRSFLGVLEQMAVSLEPRLTGPTWPDVVQRLQHEHLYRPDEAALAADCLQRLHALGALLKEHDAPLEDRAPNPRPAMRMTPRI